MFRYIFDIIAVVVVVAVVTVIGVVVRLNLPQEPRPPLGDLVMTGGAGKASAGPGTRLANLDFG